MISGKHLINGLWVDGPDTFISQVTSGQGFSIHNASATLVEEAALIAQQTHHNRVLNDVQVRAKLLRTIAEEIDRRGDDITAVGTLETGLPEARLVGERGRTTQQLNLFADHIEAGGYLQTSHDGALPEREPIPRPDLRKMMRPMGPVAVFGASNFPLAFSTAGGDTASALAAGCPVIVKGHPAHPGTSELVAQAILAATDRCGVDPGVFSLIQDSGISVAQHLVTQSAIAAVGFTGSIKGGRALFDLCSQRPEPIPFYGEMGSLNPVFVLPNALRQTSSNIAKGWVDSLNLGVGQFCTKPGILVLPSEPEGGAFIETVKTTLQSVKPEVMLTEGIATAFEQGSHSTQECTGIKPIFTAESPARQAAPHVFTTSAENWLNTPVLQEEVFGPYAIILRTGSTEEMLAVANQLSGQLTATLFLEADDANLATPLFQTLERKAGRILANGFPTGVEVAESMVHGGPYPASTSVAHTSVGTTAIQRFLRPVCYQNIPDFLLPMEIRNA